MGKKKSIGQRKRKSSVRSETLTIKNNQSPKFDNQKNYVNPENKKKPGKDLYKKIFESSTHPKCIINRSFEIIDCNHKFKELMINAGSESLEMIKITKILPEIERKRWEEFINKYIQFTNFGLVDKNNHLKLNYGGKNDQFYFDYKTNDEILKNFIITVKEITNTDYLFITIEDITKNNRAIEILKESENKFKLLFENAGEALIVTDLDGNFFELNKIGLNLLGYENSFELVNKNFIDRFDQWSRLKLNEYIEDVKKKRQVKNKELFIIQLTGARIIVEVNLSLLRNNNGTPYALLFMVKDITERKNAENALKRSEELYRGLVTTSSEIIMQMDINGDIKFINDTGAVFWGMEIKNFIGNNFKTLINKEDRKTTLKEIKKMVKTKTPIRSMINRALLSNDENHYLSWNIDVIRDLDKNILGLQAVGRDITEQKELELKLKKSHDELIQAYEELKKIDKMKTDFIHIMSHEMRTPLAIIKGYLDIFEQKILGDLNGEQTEKIITINQQIDKLIELLNQILDISRLESGDFEINVNDIEIENLIIKLTKDFQVLASEKNQKIDLNLQSSLPVIQGDPFRIKEVFTNILSNAIKYTPEKGLISISAFEESNNLHFKIADTGEGISKDNLNKIFERFFMVDTSLTRTSNRVGLGLPIAKGIIEMHGGSIWVESKLNKGSTFHITLPKNNNNKEVKK